MRRGRVNRREKKNWSKFMRRCMRERVKMNEFMRTLRRRGRDKE